jgi:F-type H+-transporting ATPase subunit b
MHIDWSTLALQTVNVLVLVWLLARFLFRPVMAIIAERRLAAEKLLADAATTRAQAEAYTAEAQHRLEGVATETEHMLTEARALAETERARLLQQAADAATHAQIEAKAAIDDDRVTMEHVLRQQACDLAIVIAHRLLRRLPVKTATAALLESLTSAVDDLPDEQRRNLAAAAGPLDIVTAAPLDDAQQMACRDMMCQVLGRTSTLVFRTDPALIAGVELHTSGILVRNSWQADLEHIAGELHQDEQHVAPSEQLV